MSTPAPDWARFHDATLVNVSFEWASATVRLGLRLVGSPPTEAVLTVRGVTLLRCPREEPWAFSESVNGVRVVPMQPHGRQVEIEMQTGDVIEIHGQMLELNAGD